MIIFFSGFILLYALVMGVLLTKWKVDSMDYLGPVPYASLIMPFRNEADILHHTLESLRDLSIEEIIFCNDQSEDNSREIIQAYINKYDLEHWKLIDNNGIGKKAAVTTAVGISSHDLIFTTDADCTVTNEGVVHMLRSFINHEIQMVCGPVSVNVGKSFLEKYQLAEWASISLVTNYFFKINKPLMCSAANMAYRKSAFLGVGGYKHNENISSGDDEYLLKKITSKFGAKSIFYTNHPVALVTTIPTTDLAIYLSQRARWAGKWKAHKQLSHAGTALLFFLFAVIQISSVLLLGHKLEYNLFFFVFWMAKSGVDFLVLGHVIKTYHRNISFIEMIGVSVYHPLSVIVIGVFSIFVKNTWKGRVVLTKA